MKITTVALGLGGLLLVRTAAAGDEPLAARAHAVLKTYCSSCHGPGGSAKGGFDFVLDRDQLMRRDKVVPGQPAESDLFRRVEKGTMPPRGKARPKAEEIALLRQWIDAGAPAAEAAPQRRYLSDADVFRRIRDDLQAVPERQRRFVRYFTLTNLFNAQRPEKELEETRRALGKLVNSLSWHPRITLPQAVDPDRVILRIDLRDYQWPSRFWDRLAFLDPYRLDRTEEPISLRADWFIATASRPPFYQDFLQLPGTDRELERQLRVSVLANLQEETAARTGFNGSGVSRNNRLIERHDAAYGAYWRSYDFANNTERRNLFDHPLGPLPGQNSFQSDGGEIIFHLPNGLFGFMLVNADGRRIDRAPVEIVSDPQRPDRAVEMGLSCMSCHAGGFLPKADQVRAHVEKNRAAFSKEDFATTLALYPPAENLQKRMDEDNERLRAALEKIMPLKDAVDPVNPVVLRYEAALDLSAVSAETGLQSAELLRRLDKSPTLTRIFGPLRTRGGTLQRDTIQTVFPELVRELGLAERPLAASGPAPTVPFAGHVGTILCMAFSPDGKFVFTSGDDRTLRLWDVASGREVRKLSGFSHPVLAVAISPDGKRALSGDRALRLWDLQTGQEIRRWQEHTEPIRCVAFAPDGRLAVSGSEDRTLRLWDLGAGQSRSSLIGHTDRVSCVTFSLDGKQIVSGSYDGTVRIWSAGPWRETAVLKGHVRPVLSLAISPDGTRAISSGSDRVAILWNLATGAELRRLDGHVNAIIAVAFTAAGRQVITATSRYSAPDDVLRRWDLGKDQLVWKFAGPTDVRVGGWAIAPDGRNALSFDPADPTPRLWNLSD